MQITVFGSGYVGLVSGTCFAQMGNHVTCVDIDQKRIDLLNNGGCPIYEPGLASMIKDNLAAKRLHFTRSVKESVTSAEVIFIAVGTPPEEDGSADLQYVLEVATSISEHLDDYKLIINKSTVPVGTADKVKATINEGLRQRGVSVEFDIASNPEFLKEGAAIADCMKPDRIVCGVDSERAEAVLQNLYAPFNRNHDKLFIMDVRSSEMTKYVANCMLATKISFMNEMSHIAEKLGADIEKVRLGIGSDSRIGYSFIYPGCGYGGSCFPKDVKALKHTAKEEGYFAQILGAVEDVNAVQKTVLFEKISRYFNGDLKGKTIALWGIAFKPNTDDIRDAPSRILIEALWNAGAKVQAYDPEAYATFKSVYGIKEDIKLCENPNDATVNADALVIATEWMAFRSPDFNLLKQNLRYPVIFDGRNLYDPKYVKEKGFEYFAIGRPVN